jgi:thioester reductase-like protein
VSGAILLTGATGFLGMDMLARLLERDSEEILMLVRARSDDEAQERLASTLAQLYERQPASAARVRAIRGDLLEHDLGLSKQDRRRLVGSVDRIVHCAASISFELPLAQAREINVQGLARMIELARETSAGGGGLRRLLHVSTAYVGGTQAQAQCFTEEQLEQGQEFRNSYERSKYEGELLLLREARDLPVVIARPSIVVGHQASGWTPAFNVIYWPMRAFERGLLTRLPARADSIVDFVPVDYVTDGVLALLEQPQAGGTYHLVAGAHALTVGELVQLYAVLVDPRWHGRAPVRLVPQDAAADLPAGAGAYVPYFDVRCRFDDTRAREALGRLGVRKPNPRDYLGRLIGYAHETAWGKRPISRQVSLQAAQARSSGHQR